MEPHERLAAARLAAGFKNANSASNAFGWPQRSYLRHETGQSSFGHLAEKYAAAFDVTVKDLLGDAPPIEKRGRRLINALPLIDPSDINALTELMRGLPPLASNPDAPPVLTYGFRSFLMIADDGSLMILDPDATPDNDDLVLAYVPSQIKPILQRHRPSNGARVIAKLVFTVVRPS